MAKRGFFFLSLLIGCLAVFSSFSKAFSMQLEGVVLSREGPVADAVVTAYPDFTSLRNNQNGILATPGEKPGQYRLSLPEGKYYLVATGTWKGKEFYGYHGLNPIDVQQEGYHWIPILVLPRNNLRCEPGYPGVGGYVLYNGEPVAGSSVSVYALAEEPFRGMGLLTNTVTEDGAFWFDLEPGEYVVFARKRFGGSAIGPIRKGDLLCYFSENPIRIPPDESCEIDVSCYPRDDIDAFLTENAIDPRGRKEQQRHEASLREADETDSMRLMMARNRRQAAVSGRVTDLAGQPLADLYVSAYPANGVPLFQMYVLRMKTEYMARTAKDGSFILPLAEGTYYLVAREMVGDAPHAGEHYGIYEGTPNHSFTLKPGEAMSDVHIIAEPIMP